MNDVTNPETATAETGPWEVTLVHDDRGDAITATFPTLEAATIWVHGEEGRRHPGRSVFDGWHPDPQRADYIQHGTGYHWVTFERLTNVTWALPHGPDTTTETPMPEQDRPTGTAGPTVAPRPTIAPRHAVARALYRRHKTREGQRDGTLDPEVYAGWFPWENLGTEQAHWLDLADVAIAALTAATKDTADA